LKRKLQQVTARRAVTWPPKLPRKAACTEAFGMCVAIKHGLVIISAASVMQLHMHSLADGSLVRIIGSRGSGKGQFNYNCGGLCVSPDGDSVLVAEQYNNRVQQLRIVDVAWERFVGKGALWAPQFLACNADVMVVTEQCQRVSVLSWADGAVLAQFGSGGSGPGQLNIPRGVCILTDGSGLVVADSNNHRLCMFRMNGEFVTTMGSRERGMHYPSDVLECGTDGSLVVVNCDDHNLVKVSREGAVVDVYGKEGTGTGEFSWPSALAALPDGGMVVQEWRGKHFQVFGGPSR
jgi:DNA-binding beta-propeller fold protein YncE